MPEATMTLKMMLPSEVLLEREVVKVTAEAANGSFCLLPRHIDFAASLVPGLFSFQSPDEEETFVAVDVGMLVKCGREVLVSIRRAVVGVDLGELETTIRQEYETVDERERMTRTAAAHLEAGLIRRFMEFEKKR